MKHSTVQKQAVRTMRKRSDLFRFATKHKCGTDVFDHSLRKRERDELMNFYGGLTQNLGYLLTQERRKLRAGR